MKIIKVSQVLLDGGTIEEIVTDIGVFRRDNKKAYFKLAKNGGYYLHSKRCAYFDEKIEEYFKNKYSQYIPTWNTNKVIDFINWYIELKGLGENNKLENQSIVDSFLIGDKIEVWKEVVNKPTIPEFKLSAKEKETAEIYLTKIKKKYGSYGHITYSFTETGVGCCIKIKSSHKDKWRDITDLDIW